MTQRLTRLFLFILLVPFTAAAQTGQVINLSLEDALKYAEQNQVKIKNAILDERSSLSKSAEVTGLAYPQLKAKGGVSYAPLVAAFEVPNFIKSAIAGDAATGQQGLVNSGALNNEVVNNTPNTIPLAFQPKWSTNAALELNQILFDPAVMVALQARKALQELAAKNTEITVTDVKVAVTKAYYSILIAEKQKAIMDQNLSVIEHLEFEMKERYKVGFIEKIDVDRVTVALNNIKTMKLRVDQTISLAYLALKFQMGMPLAQSISLTDKLPNDNAGSEILNEEFSLESRKEFQLLQTQKRFLSYDVKRYSLGWLPSVSLFGNYGYTLYNADKLFDTKDKWQKSALIGTNVAIPIFDGFQRRQKLLQARFAVEKTENQLENLKSALQLEKENARLSLKNNLVILQNQKGNMELAESVYSTTRIKFNEGVGTSLEVMNAETALKEAQANYFLALYDVINSRVDLQKALGQL
jgi:outer membrane protein